MNSRWLPVLKRIGVALLIVLAANLAVMAFWSPAWFTYWQVPITCTVLICLIGVLLFDLLMQGRSR